MVEVSVITPVFKASQKIEATLASVASQRVSRIEHIILDGGPSDGTEGALNRLSPSVDYPIRYIRESDQGIYDAMNKGIRQARGRYLYFLCAGDCLVEGILRRILTSLPSHERGFVYGDVMRPDGRYGRKATRHSLFRRTICHQAIFYGRDVFSRVGLYSLRYPVAADHEMNMRCFADPGIERIYIPEVICDFEGGGISDRGDPAMVADYPMLVRTHLGFGPYMMYRYWWWQRHFGRRVRRVSGRILGKSLPVC